MSKVKVLFVDDDLLIGSVVTLSLKESGYDVHYQSSIVGLQSVILEYQPHVVVLDVEVGADNGIDAVPLIRSLTPGIPVIFVSSHVESSTIARAISSGGEVYLKKPFEVAELIVYIEKYTNAQSSTEIKFGSCILNFNNRVLTINGEEKKLGLSECRLLTLFASKVNCLVSRAEIEQVLYRNAEVNEYSINNLMAKLRKLLLKDQKVALETRHKQGYILLVKVDK